MGASPAPWKEWSKRMTTGQGQRCHHVVSNVHHDHDGTFNIFHDSRIFFKVREASEDPDLVLYLEENIQSLTPTDIAGLLDYQVTLLSTRESYRKSQPFYIVLMIDGEPKGSDGSEGGFDQGEA